MSMAAFQPVTQPRVECLLFPCFVSIIPRVYSTMHKPEGGEGTRWRWAVAHFIYVRRPTLSDAVGPSFVRP